MEFKTVKVSSIKVNREERFREDLGDLSGMVATIKSGLYIQPISVDEDMNLIAGERRLQAHKVAGLEEILARVWIGLTEKQKLEIQHIENDQRKELLPSEKAKALKKLQADEPSKQGERADLKVFKDTDSTCVQMRTSSKTQSKEEKRRHRLAKKAGFENADEARRTEKVLDKSPKELMSAVDAKIVSVSDAAAIADEPAEKQLEALERVKAGTAKTLKAGLKEPKQSAKSKAAIQAALNHKAPSADSEPELDVNGRVIPVEISQVVVDGVAFNEFTRHLASMITLIKDCRLDGHRSAHLSLSALNDAENLKRALQGNTFYCVCVYCDGSGKDGDSACRGCRGGRWINKDAFDRAPREKKKAS